ncbi:MAG TPA: hypothetical protein VFZ77_03005 [Acidimicrobiales bacterium]
MSTPPPGAPGGEHGGEPPPPPPPPPPGDGGPWRSDRLPPHPIAAVSQAELGQPPTIRAAVRLMWVGAALSLISALTTFFVTDEIREQVRESEPTLTSSEVDSAVAVAVTFIVIVGLVVVGLWIWMAVANGRGRTWARVVATVFGVLNLLFTLGSLGMDTTTGLNVALSFVSVALAVAILVLLYRPASSRFYEAHRRAGA